MSHHHLSHRLLLQTLSLRQKNDKLDLGVMILIICCLKKKNYHLLVQLQGVFLPFVPVVAGSKPGDDIVKLMDKSILRWAF